MSDLHVVPFFAGNNLSLKDADNGQSNPYQGVYSSALLREGPSDFSGVATSGEA